MEGLAALTAIAPSERVLLLPHCMRPSQSCPGRFSKEGLVCPPDCALDCPIRRLRDAALALGYKGVCVAAGGRMALRFLKEHHPRGIVAVACPKELEEGKEGLEQVAGPGHKVPPTIAVPLSVDGCVDTEVDETLVLEALRVGCNGHGLSDALRQVAITSEA